MSIGTHSSCDIHIKDNLGISPYHALFTFANGNFYLKDLDSQYGTFIEAEG